jgi:predicted membrane channel-forming protein YqfA (hemolysin III family)
MLHLLIFHFPSTPEAILNSVAVLFFCAGVLFWCISSILYRIVNAAAQGNVVGWQKLEFIGTLILIGATTVPFVVLQFATEPSTRLSYLSALALVTVSFLVDLFTVEPNEAVIRERFPYHCASLGLLMLVPAIHELSEHRFEYTTLVLQFVKVAIYNALAGILFLLKPLERTRVITSWRPSLYAMHFVLVYSAVTYSMVVLHVLVEL